jgi:hypothetical protein
VAVGKAPQVLVVGCLVDAFPKEISWVSLGVTMANPSEGRSSDGQSVKTDEVFGVRATVRYPSEETAASRLIVISATCAQIGLRRYPPE